MNKPTEEDYKNSIHELELQIRQLNMHIDYLEKEIKKLQS
jgi:hypothetical protein